MLSNNALSQHTYKAMFLQIHVRNVVGRNSFPTKKTESTHFIISAHTTIRE
jgi:hypothetical protein